MPSPGTPAPSPAARSSMTVAASRGVAGSALLPAMSSALAASAAGALSRMRPMAYLLSGGGSAVADLGDQLDLHRGVQRQHRDADRAPGMPSGLAEHSEQQFACTVKDLGLPAETGRACHEASDLDDAPDRLQPAGYRGHRGERVQGAGGRQPGSFLGAD